MGPRSGRPGLPDQAPGPPLINYVRIPVAFSLLLLLAFFPLILGLSEPEYHRASGLTTQPYLWRWLAVTGVLFAGSAVIYALRWRRALRARRPAEQAARARAQQPPPAAQDPVPSPAAPRPGFDVWHPARPCRRARTPPALTASMTRPIPDARGSGESASPGTVSTLASPDDELRPPPGRGSSRWPSRGPGQDADTARRDSGHGAGADWLREDERCAGPAVGGRQLQAWYLGRSGAAYRGRRARTCRTLRPTRSLATSHPSTSSIRCATTPPAPATPTGARGLCAETAVIAAVCAHNRQVHRRRPGGLVAADGVIAGQRLGDREPRRGQRTEQRKMTTNGQPRPSGGRDRNQQAPRPQARDPLSRRRPAGAAPGAAIQHPATSRDPAGGRRPQIRPRTGPH